MTEHELWSLWNRFDHDESRVSIVIDGNDVTKYVKSLVLQHEDAEPYGETLTIGYPGWNK